MLIGFMIQMLLNLVGMSMQVLFYAVAAYWVAKMARKGWNAGK